MNFLEASKKRYATKRYAGEKLSDHQINALMQILQLSPSSINSQPWHFFIIGDDALKRKLAAVSMSNESAICEASHLVVFCVQSDLAKLEAQMQATIPQAWLPFYDNIVKTDDTAAKVWAQKQVYLSLGYFLAGCAAMDIDATPMEGLFPEEYDRILDIKNGYKTLCAVALGHRHPDDGFDPARLPKQRLAIDEIITLR